MILAYDYDDGISHRFGGAAAPPQAVPFVAPVVAEIQGFFLIKFKSPIPILFSLENMNSFKVIARDREKTN